MKTRFVAAVCGAAILGLVTLSPSAFAKTAKECTAEWNANKAALLASGKTQKKYVADCRATASEAGQLPTVAATPTAKAAAAAPTGKDQYAKEDEAKAHCAADPVVWVNLSSKIYHASGTRSYGKTKRGAYMCEKEATTAGFRAPKTRAKKS